MVRQLVNWQSTKMNAVQLEYGRPLEEILSELQNERGASAPCDPLGISKATLGYWNLKCGIKVIRVAYQPAEGEDVKVYDKNGGIKFSKNGN